MNFKQLPLVTTILDKLKRDLPNDLYYHNYDHTLDVIEEVLCYAKGDNLNDREIELLVVAAAYHDAGFLSQRRDNEDLGAKMAEEAMSIAGGYSVEEVDLVKTMILDTKMQVAEGGFKQIPTTRLSGYLLDADVSNLGRKDFFDKGKLVLKELNLPSAEMFLEHSLNLLEAHQWHTGPANRLREEQKQENIKSLRALINSKQFLL